MAEIDEHIGCAMSGLTADARTLIDHARVETQVCAFPTPPPIARVHTMPVFASDGSSNQGSAEAQRCAQRPIYNAACFTRQIYRWLYSGRKHSGYALQYSCAGTVLCKASLSLSFLHWRAVFSQGLSQFSGSLLHRKIHSSYERGSLFLRRLS